MPQMDKAARAEYDRQYRAKNKERKAAKEARWRAENADHLKARGAKRRLEKRAMCLIAAARVRSRNKGYSFGLDEFSDQLQARIDAGHCELSGVPFDLSPGRKPNSPSLDRIDPAQGYVPDNVRVICHALNAALGDWGEELLAPIMDGWLAKRKRYQYSSGARVHSCLHGVHSMSTRKPNNTRARMHRAMSAVLRTSAVAVINLDPSGRQGLVNYRNCKSIPPGRHVANAVCDIAHRWTIYLAGLCIDQNGYRYIKAQEVAPDGLYLADHLTDVIETCYRALLDTCNPQQLVASGWIAVPDQVSLDEAHAARIFEACGAWPTRSAA